MNPNFYIKSPLILCIALLFVSCAKEVPVAEQAADILVVEATLVVGEPIQEVFIHGLRGVVEDQTQSSLQVELISPTERLFLSPIADKPGYYQGPETYLIEPETSYALSIPFNDELVQAETETPPIMEALSYSKDYIDAEMQGDLVFLEWTGVNMGSFNEYFYVIELTPLDSEAEAIVRLGEDPKTTNVLSYTSEATLSIEDFNFYGPHSIKVYAVSKDYESLFTPQSTPEINGPTNIQNGYGYFLGTSVIEGDLEIL
jgi:hypothetical protein